MVAKHRQKQLSHARPSRRLPVDIVGKRIERSRLLAQVEDGMQRALTLVAAPAGFGKTTLVAAWAQTASIPVAWLSLEAADRAPERFLTYLIYSIQQIASQVGNTALALLRSGQAFSETGVLYSLVNDFAEVPHDFVFILDDYHATDCPEIAEIIQFLLEHRPAHFHLVITSRTVPDLNLARLRALDQFALHPRRDSGFSGIGDECKAYAR